ncbi:MAG: hypothetical protein H7836_09420 [Magnetococcus sp. YQC-3]
MQAIKSEGFGLVNSIPPEMRVWAAVLHQTILDLRNPKRKQAALAWLNSHMDGPGSLLFVCGALNAEPGYIRRLVMQKVPCAMVQDAA